MVKTQERFPLSFILLLSLSILFACGKKDEEEVQSTNTTPVVAQPTPIIPMSSSEEDTATAGMSRAQDLSLSQNCLKYWNEQDVHASVNSSLSAGSFTPYQLMSSNTRGQRPRGMRGAYSPEHLALLNQSILCINELNRIATILNYFQRFYAPGAVQGYLGRVLNAGYAGIGNGVGVDPLGGGASAGF